MSTFGACLSVSGTALELWTRWCALARLALQGHREQVKVVCYKLAWGRQMGSGKWVGRRDLATVS